MTTTKPKIEIKIVPKSETPVVISQIKAPDVKKKLERVLELIIDIREKEAPKILSFFQKESKIKVKCSTATLDVGDFLFRYSDDTKLVLIERKTISDLLSSIKGDNRYKEQKTRLKAFSQKEPNMRICYMIAGIFSVKPIDKFFTEIDAK